MKTLWTDYKKDKNNVITYSFYQDNSGVKTLLGSLTMNTLDKVAITNLINTFNTSLFDNPQELVDFKTSINSQ